jgi:hypothetical protein
MKHQQADAHPAKKARAAVPKAAAEAAAANTTNVTMDGRDEFIRQAAYSYYEARGCIDGHELDDWLRAEAEFERTQGDSGPDGLADTVTH